jgi:hypothetical protein
MNLNLTNLPNREALPDFLNAEGLNGEGVEIGCMYGWFSSVILSKWNGRKYYMVDPWELQPSDVYPADQSMVRYDLCEAQCRGLCRVYPIAECIKAYSPGAAGLFLDGQLDFAFIDGNHEYKAVMADLNAWWPKVKAGGLFGWHDHYDCIIPPHWTEVKRAVEDWLSIMEMSMKDVLLTPCSSGWIEKR